MIQLLQGNQAIFRGALAAGASFYAGYPISPSSEVMAEAAKYASQHPEFRFLQTEDEISAATAVVGASLAGARSFTATSGPGFSLMQETLGMGYAAEVPCVFVDVQRVGPSTGMPTMIAQGDILQAAHGSHGDYYALAFYPSSVAECYSLTATAFRASEEAGQPVILLSDAQVSHLYELVDLESIPVTRGERTRLPLGTGQRHFTGLAHDDDGVPRTAEPDPYVRWLGKVRDRSAEVASRYALYEYPPNREADTLIISFGIISRVVRDLPGPLAHFRPIRMLPLLARELIDITAQYPRVVVIEASDGQYAGLVEYALRRDVIRIPVLGGRVSLDRITADLQAKLAGS